MQEVDSWTKQQEQTQGASDPYWRQAGLLRLQIEGLVDGHNNHTTADKHIDHAFVVVVNSLASFPDIAAYSGTLTAEQFVREDGEQLDAVMHRLCHGADGGIHRLSPAVCAQATTRVSWAAQQLSLLLQRCQRLPHCSALVKPVHDGRY